MITLSKFIKVFKMPDLLYIKFISKKHKNDFKCVTFNEFLQKYDFKKIQVIKCEQIYKGWENGSEYIYLTLRKLK